MPRVWDATIEEHRRAVRNATIRATADLIAEHGVLSVTMSQIAAKTGIGRATLYRYFADVDAILVAWHEEQVTSHLRELSDIRDRHTRAIEQLEAVLAAYARIAHEHRGGELAALLHGGEHVARGHQELTRLVQKLLTEAVADGDVRDDVAPAELAVYCLHAVGAARDLPSSAAVRRLVSVVLRSVNTSRR